MLEAVWIGFAGVMLLFIPCLHEDEAARIVEADADHAYLTMVEAGVGLAEHVKKRLELT